MAFCVRMYRVWVLWRIICILYTVPLRAFGFHNGLRLCALLVGMAIIINSTSQKAFLHFATLYIIQVVCTCTYVVCVYWYDHVWPLAVTVATPTHRGGHSWDSQCHLYWFGWLLRCHTGLFRCQQATPWLHTSRHPTQLSCTTTDFITWHHDQVIWQSHDLVHRWRAEIKANPHKLHTLTDHTPYGSSWVCTSAGHTQEREGRSYVWSTFHSCHGIGEHNVRLGE